MGGHIEYYGGNGGSGGPGINGSGMMPMQIDDNIQMQLQQQQQQQQQQHQQQQQPPPQQQQPPQPQPQRVRSQMTNCGPSSSHSSTGSFDDLLNDEVLMSLTVRDLNKRLQGCPREEVSGIV